MGKPAIIGYMDYVYICRDGENEELRYSIRSVEANLPSGKVWVVGGKPSWYIGNHISVPQKYGKYENLKENAKAISLSPDISNSFIIMNDDFYIIKPVDSVENFNGGKLIDKANLYDSLDSSSKYTKRLFDTNAKLLEMGVESPVDFELHVPMIITKSGLWQSVKYDLLWRSMYGNLYGINSKTMKEDVKVYVNSRLVPKGYDTTNLKYPYLSSDDKSFGFLYKKILKEMFKAKSSYER
jgi:hypothetical protein